MEKEGIISETWRQLHPIVKGIVVITATGVVVFAGYKLYKSFNKSDVDKKKVELAENINSEISTLQKKMTPSYNASQYLVFANEAYEGMKYGLGDDYGNVRDVLQKMKNDLDVAL